MNKKQKLHPAVTKHFAELGAKGGSVKSEAKAKAARANAKKPRKKKGSKDATRND